MTITNIMHVTGSKADLYSSSYFKKVEGMREPVNPFKKWVDGRLYAFGTVTTQIGEERIALDLTASQEAFTFVDSDDPIQMINDVLNENEPVALTFLTSNPPIPPSNSYISWDYQYRIKEHQYSNWVVDENDSQSGRWEATTEEETQWLNSKGEVITPTLVDHDEAQYFHTYYFINKYDYPVPYFVDVEMFVGDNIEAMREVLEEQFGKKYPELKRKGEIDIKIYCVDIRQAKQVDTETEHNNLLMGFWLGKVDVYPRMISVDQNPNVVATYGSHTEPKMTGDFEYRHSLPDAVFGFNKTIVNVNSTIPICNGLVCYPRVISGKIFASQGQRLSYNEKDRNRRWILLDFAPVGGCTVTQLSKFNGTLSEMILPEGTFDSSTQTAFLILRGRMFFPGEFEIVENKRLFFDPNKYTTIYELDRMLCRGDFTYNMANLEPKRYNVTQKIGGRIEHVDHNEGEKFLEDVHVYSDLEKETNPDVIYYYDRTHDTEFQEDKKYFIQINGEYIEINTSDLIGQPIDKQTTYKVKVLTFKKSTDTVFDENKQYFMLNDKTGLFDPVEHKYLQYKDPDKIYIQEWSEIVDDKNLYFSKKHEDGCLVFSEFYEEAEEFYPVYAKEWETKLAKNRLDIKNDDNSFLIVVNRPALQIVNHRAFQRPKPITKMPWGSDSHASLDRVDFDRQARGLLFDATTKSFIDYTRETQTLTFYADKCRKWGIANVYIPRSTPIAIKDENAHNLMSARGFTLDDVRKSDYDFIDWPRLSILDFIFRG